MADKCSMHQQGAANMQIGIDKLLNEVWPLENEELDSILKSPYKLPRTTSLPTILK